MHAIVEYTLPSLFSLRMLTANAFAARTLPCPTPASVKLGVLSGLIRRDGPDSGEGHLRWLAPLGVAWTPPVRMTVTAATVRVWKSDQPDEPLDFSAGMREYLHAMESFTLALLDIPDGREDDIAFGLSRLRALGTAESLVQPLAPPSFALDLPPGMTVLTEDGQQVGEVACVLDDLGPAASFERLSVYRSPGRNTIPRLGEDRIRRLVRLPLRVTRRTADGYSLERVE